jgi:hypothetical protein
MQRRSPNLFIIGAMKSGTSTLHRVLDTHPRIQMSEPKEPSYFVADTAANQDFAHRGLDAYLQLFEGAPQALYRGEASTNYTKAPLLPCPAARLAAFSPSARLIYVVRNPVERAIGHYWHRVQNHAESRRLLDALLVDDHYLTVGDYARQLEPYVNCFDRAQVFVLTLEMLQARTERALADLFEWLGLDVPDTAVTTAGLRANVTPRTVYQTRLTGRLGSAIASGPMRKALKSMPGNTGDAVAQRLYKRRQRSTVDDSEARGFLARYYRTRIREFETMIGRKLPEWDSLDIQA